MVYSLHSGPSFQKLSAHFRTSGHVGYTNAPIPVRQAPAGLILTVIAVFPLALYNTRFPTAVCMKVKGGMSVN